MSAHALEALATAQSAGVRISLDGDEYPQRRDPLPPDIVALLRTVKPELLIVLAGREAAKATIEANPPPDCLPQRWVTALDGLRRFVADGWGDQAALLGWSPAELYGVPRVWRRIDLCGAALLVGDARVMAVTEASIAIETLSGSQLKFRRIGREHLA